MIHFDALDCGRRSEEDLVMFLWTLSVFLIYTMNEQPLDNDGAINGYCRFS